MTHPSTEPDFPPLTPQEVEPFRKLADYLKVGGVAQVVCSAVLSFLALTGYETARPVNLSLLIIAVVFFITGGGAAATGRSLAAAVGGAGDKAALVAAMRGLAGMHRWVMGLLCVAAFLIAIEAAGHLGRITGFLGGQ